MAGSVGAWPAVPAGFLAGSACSGCMFFDATTIPGNPNTGLCRRDAPTIQQTAPGQPNWATWPMVKTVDWCGEWNAAVGY